jgi:hypothetical protein
MHTPADPQLITYREALARLGFSRRTLFDRIKETGIVVYVDGVNRRQRLLDVRDLPKLTEAQNRRLATRNP